MLKNCIPTKCQHCKFLIQNIIVKIWKGFVWYIALKYRKNKNGYQRPGILDSLFAFPPLLMPEKNFHKKSSTFSKKISIKFISNSPIKAFGAGAGFWGCCSVSGTAGLSVSAMINVMKPLF